MLHVVHAYCLMLQKGTLDRKEALAPPLQASKGSLPELQAVQGPGWAGRDGMDCMPLSRRSGPNDRAQGRRECDGDGDVNWGLNTMAV